MSSGKTHDTLTILLLTPVLLWSLLVLKLEWITAIIVTAGFGFGGIYLSPDLDTRSRPFYRWGLFRFIWWPYQWMVRHRSRWSHGIFTGTLFRLTYFSSVLVLAWFLIRYGIAQWGGQNPPLWVPRQELLGFIHACFPKLMAFGLGLWGGCLLHILLDALGLRIRLPRL